MVSYELIKVDTFKEAKEKAKEGYILICYNQLGYILQKEIINKKNVKGDQKND